MDHAKFRTDTPACETLAHFNNAGATLMPTPVFTVMTEHQTLEQAVGGYEAQADAAPLLVVSNPMEGAHL